MSPSTTLSDRCGPASRELARLGRPLIMSGHSAGGHLAACMLATDWQALSILSLPKQLVICGLHHFRPVRPRAAGRNLDHKALRLDQETAKAASPLFWKPPAHGSLDAVVGADESAEYFRQSTNHCRTMGRGPVFQPGSALFPTPTIFTAIAPLGRSRFPDGSAPEAIGGTLGFKKSAALPGF